MLNFVIFNEITINLFTSTRFKTIRNGDFWFIALNTITYTQSIDFGEPIV
jgi:hypothetical protein